MPYPFALPTTSSVLLSDFFDSVTHPSLPLATATQRSVVRDALKQYKRLPPQSRSARLPAIQDALANYLAHLLALNAGIGYAAAGGPVKLDVEVRRPLAVEWRSTLSASPPGREPARVKLVGLHHELAFALSTLAYTHSLLARAQLLTLQPSASASPAAGAAAGSEPRKAAIQAAMKHLFAAHAFHSYVLKLPSSAAGPGPPATTPPAIDTAPSTVAGLAKLALAEATLVVAAKDDPYAAAEADARNAASTEWMYRAPRIEKARASALVRICMRAAEYAAEAAGSLAAAGAAERSSSERAQGRLDEAVVRYASDLRRTARGRAARFHAIEAEMGGRTGEALAWLRGARKELGLDAGGGDGSGDAGSGGGGGRGALRGLRQNWRERREERRVERGGEDWGLDAGRLDEARVVEMLAAKWERENAVVNVQVVPPFEPLLAALPSGRSPFEPPPFVPPALDADVLARMRAPPDPDEAAFRGNEDDSDVEDGYGLGAAAPAGAFPGTEGEYGRSTPNTNYY